jgi:CRISPR-associated protein Csd1
LKGIRYANTTGASLVGFNGRAYESYNRVNGQGLNAPVSEKATFAYTTALNYLLSSANPNKQFSIGNSTVVYWAESEKKEYAATFSSIFEPEYVEQPTDDVEGPSGKIAGKVVRRVQSLDLNILRNGLNDSTRFYVLGLSPNAGRTSVRFFVDDSFDKIIGCILQNYDDLRIIKEYENQPTYITVGQILSETVSKRAQDKDASPLMAGSVMRAILTGAPYPAALYYAIINRIRRDMDDPQNNIKKISYARAAIIKAYFLRKYRNQSKYQEVLGMSLNEQSIIPAYVLGRLFAVLEKVQQEAIGEMNATIKDRYFTSVCASPARIFPVLLRLSQYQISKTKYGNAYKRRIQDLLNLLDVEKKPIPVSMSLDEQGIFVLGYYHQRVDLYIPRTDKNLVEVDPSVTN